MKFQKIWNLISIFEVWPFVCVCVCVCVCRLKRLIKRCKHDWYAVHFWFDFCFGFALFFFVFVFTFVFVVVVVVVVACCCLLACLLALRRSVRCTSFNGIKALQTWLISGVFFLHLLWFCFNFFCFCFGFYFCFYFFFCFRCCCCLLACLLCSWWATRSSGPASKGCSNRFVACLLLLCFLLFVFTFVFVFVVVAVCLLVCFAADERHAVPDRLRKAGRRVPDADIVISSLLPRRQRNRSYLYFLLNDF